MKVIGSIVTFFVGYCVEAANLPPQESGIGFLVAGAILLLGCGFAAYISSLFGFMVVQLESNLKSILSKRNKKVQM